MAANCNFPPIVFSFALALSFGVAPLAADDLFSARDAPQATFVNPIAEGADPSVVKDGNRYLWCQSEGNRGIAIWVSDRPTSIGRKHVIWRAPPTGPISRQVWAPEIVKLDDRWYVYFAASDGKNENHRTYVLASAGSDPLGQYTLHGPLYTGDDFERKDSNIWAIDMVVLEHGQKRYALWSGWSESGNDHQYLYIAAMKSPLELSPPRVRLCAADDYLWERTEENKASRGLHEAPQVLVRGARSNLGAQPERDRTFVIYSCAASWLPTYKLGMLELAGDDPLDPASWKKFPEPVFQSSQATYGVGHGSFILSPDETQWWHVFHAKVDRQPGWRRAIFVQPMDWTSEGLPLFGDPVAAGRPQRLPAGTPVARVSGAHTIDFSRESARDRFDLYGHHQLIQWQHDGVAVGLSAEGAVNAYRCGEKLLLRDGAFRDVELAARFSFVAGDRDAGILFRTTAAAIGFDSQRGYFAGLIPARGTVVLGKTDGKRWHHLVDAPVDFDSDRPQQLRVRAIGSQIEVYVNEADTPTLTWRDGDYASGSVGIRVVNTHTLFHQLTVKPLN